MNCREKDIHYEIFNSLAEIEKLPNMKDFIYLPYKNKVLAINYDDIRRILLIHGHKNNIVSIIAEFFYCVHEHYKNGVVKSHIFLKG